MRRSRMAYLPFVFPLLAIAEISAFVAVAHLIGAGWAFLLLAGFTLAGFALLRQEGIRGWRHFQEAAAAGRPPGAEVANSLVGLGGALLLALPGFVTGLAGLALLLPPGRIVARRGVERFAERRLGGGVTGDLFGPRKVRVHVEDTVDSTVVTDDVPRQPAAAIEGEIVR
ncbi:FxsA family protein [Actinoplanes awajinensis]|uniref:Exlusion protein FxsA n=1 Tax=Actinoplanes awajinensis subsp. mycoplanecinus TaxID=135947 RepID=A0A101JRW7_9ACTN|nr:FxsA family protein [Actinoplanes awajinensis]KUL31955.1 exlusion protein FxsA [Actinoplanes awajinensis subsp. mycoplanecinus]